MACSVRGARSGVLIILLTFSVLSALAPPVGAAGFPVFLPLVSRTGGGWPPGESYGTLPVLQPPTDHPAAEHPDLNLALRGYVANAAAYKGLVNDSGPADPKAPQLLGLFADHRAPLFSNLYRVYQWDGSWPFVPSGVPIATSEVTLAGLSSTAGETVRLPDSGYDIGSGYEALVLYASSERLTLKYTREDNVVHGYTLHLENIIVAPALLARYEACNGDGRGRLPALRAGQLLGRARGHEVAVAIRDTGSFMDPRSRKDWWQALPSIHQMTLGREAADSTWLPNSDHAIQERGTVLQQAE